MLTPGSRNNKFSLKKPEQIHGKLLRIAKVSCPQLAEVISQNGVLKLRRAGERTLFAFLVRTVAGQQLSKAAAQTIYNRLLSKCDQNEAVLFDLFVKRRKRTLLSCGLSRSKAEALCRLREAFEAGLIDERKLKKATPQEITEQISSLWGFGRWSADMVAMFYIHHQDVWPDGDGAIRRGLKLLQISDSSSVVDSFSPYRSFLALHIWKGLDNKKITISSTLK